MAKALAADLKARGLEGHPYNKCLDLVAAMYGYPDYAALIPACGHPVSGDDAVAGPAVAAERRTLQVAVLTDAGIPAAIAAMAIDAVKPTDRSDPRKAGLFAQPDDKVHADYAKYTGRLLRLRRYGAYLMEYVRVGRENETFDMIEETHLMDLIEDHVDYQRFVIQAVDFHLAGGTIMDFRDLMMCWIGSTLETDDDKNTRTLPARAGRAVYAFLDTLEYRYPKLEDDDGEAVDDMLGLVSDIGYDDELTDLGNAKDCKAYLGKAYRELTFLDDMGMTMADIAACAAHNFAVVASLVDGSESDFVSRDTPLPPLDGLPAGILANDPAAYDAMTMKAVARARGRGFPKLPVQTFRFILREDVAGFIDAAGHAATGTDALLAAEAAGATLHDLIASVNYAGPVCARIFKLDPPVRAAWENAFAAVAEGPGTATADLVKAVHCLGFLPRISHGPRVDPAAPAVYLAEIEALRRASDAGIGISDLLAEAFGHEIAEWAERSRKNEARRRDLDAAMDAVSAGH